MWGYLAAYFLSIFVAHFVLGLVMKLIRETTGSEVYHEDDGRSAKNRRWQQFWIGGTERAIVTTLVIFSPKSVPIFIGGWVAAKLAAGWTRFSGVKYASGNMISLVGSAFSMAAAIAAGLMVAPNFLDQLNGVEAKAQPNK